MLRQRAGIDPGDPLLRERARCTFAPGGVRSVTAAADITVPWTGVTGLVEEGGVLLVKTGRLTGFVLPRRDLTDDEVAAIRRIVARHTRG